MHGPRGGGKEGEEVGEGGADVSAVFVDFDAGEGEGAERDEGVIWVWWSGGGGGGCYDGDGVHELFELFAGVVFELLEVEVGFVPDGEAVPDYVRGAGAMWLDVVGTVDCFVVAAVDDFAVQWEGGEVDFEADDVAFADLFASWHEVFGSRHVHFLTGYIPQTVAIGVEAYRCV